MGALLLVQEAEVSFVIQRRLILCAANVHCLDCVGSVMCCISQQWRNNAGDITCAERKSYFSVPHSGHTFHLSFISVMLDPSDPGAEEGTEICGY